MLKKHFLLLSSILKIVVLLNSFGETVIFYFGFFEEYKVKTGNYFKYIFFLVVKTKIRKIVNNVFTVSFNTFSICLMDKCIQFFLNNLTDCKHLNISVLKTMNSNNKTMFNLCNISMGLKHDVHTTHEPKVH